MRDIKKMGIFCGSSTPGSPEICNDTIEFLKDLFATKTFDIVYGGANIGFMGQVADIAMRNSRIVHGVMPRFLKEKEVNHQNLSSFEECSTMHERKETMYALSDAFLILPGGFGTLDEFFEVLTWRQLGLHSKPIFLYNPGGFYDFLLSHIDLMHEQGLIKKSDRELIKEVTHAKDLS